MVVKRLLEESGGRSILGRGRLIQDGILRITWKGLGGVFKVHLVQMGNRQKIQFNMMVGVVTLC